MNPEKIIDGKLDAKWDFDRLNFFGNSMKSLKT